MKYGKKQFGTKATQSICPLKKKLMTDIRRDTLLYVMLVPGIVYVLMFKYAPMFGVSIAFRDYSIFRGFSDAPFVGMANFQKLFSRSAFIRALRNNVLISVLKLILGFPFPIILSLMISEIYFSGAKKFVQTAVILPNFVSWIVINGILFAMFNTSSGAIPGLMRSLGYTGDITNIMNQKETFVWVIVFSHIWKGAGMGTIVYLASIAGIDRNLYEAASIDGAGRFRKMWHITLSSIRPTIVVLLIFRVGEMMYAGFDQIFAISNYLVVSNADIIDTFVYRLGLEQQKFSEAAAAGLFQSAIGLTLVLITNAIAKKIDADSGIM
ncbi:ABC-type polysaccharide transport system, permease component [Sphaerochaeta pleomorpha str. Grapes]|uniref:ABC-type polysaccharide transport system, permease component n=1 Tax=Sphaerochaeta pleomorpha (strain ATCC BAA-1885 / DSM 22778 / Grapes) TaxID=158190 RepID=G8QWA3_SPHPG|nr:ABC transporter permease subunit [Sphaerochaeta pleomorpha]AEV29401.1 ABC-type polysaccharide transport system, permease component [Sphaerochaeta pleomorpha str. Grapes]